jgi:hypothetical protein
VDAEQVHHVLAGEVAQRLLAEQSMARLAYNAPDGTPRVVPVGFFWVDERLTVCTATNAAKVRALEADPHVALEIDSNGAPLLLLRGTASLETVDGIPAEYYAAEGIAEDQREHFRAEVTATYPQMVRITIHPTWAKAIDFENNLPSAVEELMAQRAARGD